MRPSFDLLLTLMGVKMFSFALMMLFPVFVRLAWQSGFLVFPSFTKILAKSFTYCFDSFGPLFSMSLFLSVRDPPLALLERVNNPPSWL